MYKTTPIPAMNKPTTDDAVREMRSLIPDLVQWPRHFAGRSDDADVWLRTTEDQSEIAAIAIEVPAAGSSRTDAVLGKFCQVAHVERTILDAAVREARTIDTPRPSHRKSIPGATLTVTRFPDTIAVRIDYQ
jgi:hypothetical protein